MIRIVVGISETFDSAHYIPNHPKCGRVHGHTYRVEIEVEGVVRDGMVVDFEELKEKVKSVISELDHRLLNELLENPTCENLCLFIYERLRDLMGEGLRISRVRVYENPDKWAELIP